MSEQEIAGAAVNGPEDRVRQALSRVIDPEIGCNVVELGLVYGVAVEESGVVVSMTMTTAACPLGDYLASEAEQAIRRDMPEVGSVRVDLVWEPAWNPSMMSESARTLLRWGRADE